MGRVYEQPFEVVPAGPEGLPPLPGERVRSRRPSRRLPHRLRPRRQRLQGRGRHRRRARLQRGDPLDAGRAGRPRVSLRAHPGRPEEGRLPPAPRRRHRRQLGRDLIDNQVRIASLFRSVPADVFEPQGQGHLRPSWRPNGASLSRSSTTARSRPWPGRCRSATRPCSAWPWARARPAASSTTTATSPAGSTSSPSPRSTSAPTAVADEWSGDRGVGANYFSQQAVEQAGPRGPACPSRRTCAARTAQGGPGARRPGATCRRPGGSSRTIGDLPRLHRPLVRDVLRLQEPARPRTGHVRGRAGTSSWTRPAKVLRHEFPETAARVRLHLLDEKSRRVGQAVAAASLPRIR